ncbi:rhoptry neck protein 2 [Diplodia corticola]|uniref:Rhoptry neck protein 2 n=1 Tax=Diplodia corticola TaxID=236234 RepID=A0A1J9R6L0_9PEZI|nr:rhoptry neck protein 2 [Diplodia corticola]OJD35858.1 rhoptry neck protein 2 [Diplodia corticola]
MADRETPRRSGKHHPKDVPKMTEEQKEALCNVNVTSDLYHDQRSLVQIWRDAGIRYDEHVMPPPSGPRAHGQQHRQTNGSRGSSVVGSSVVGSSGPSSAHQSMSQSLVPIGSPPFRNHPVTNFTNGTYPNGSYSNANYTNGTSMNSTNANGYNANGYNANGGYMNEHYQNGNSVNANHTNGTCANGAYANSTTSSASVSQSSNGFHLRAPSTFDVQQQAAFRPAPRMGDPATAYFVPSQASTNTATATATEAANADNFRANNIDSDGFFTKSSDDEIAAMLRRLMPNGQPNAVEEDLARFYNTQRDGRGDGDGDGDGNGQDGGAGADGPGHRRMNTR